MKLVLFDLDGTLLASKGVGRQALELAFGERYGWVDATVGISFGGMTDPLILERVFQAQGRPAAEARAEQVDLLACYVRHLEALLAKQPDACWALPGTSQLLTQLEAEGDCGLGVLTGNVEAGARLKLRAAGFPDRFDQVGAFGDEAPARNDLLPVALQRWNATAARRLTPADVVIVGDTPKDIAVARAHGARVVAVSTGVSSAETLRAHTPDVLLDTLADLDQSLAAILGD